MVNVTVRDILKATGGELLSGNEDTELLDICTDSRKIKAGDLFVPLLGEKVDSHIFIDKAMEVGAATLTSEHDGIVESDKAYIRVDNTRDALQDIGLYIIKRYDDMPYIGVTGSVGKTTTREMITAAISTSKRCFHTKENRNSQVGVPVTLSELDKGYEAAVIEMGISEPGEMERLSRMVMPSICVVTIIGVAHIEHMGSKENIRNEKLKIASHMKEGGIMLLNGDDPLLNEVKGRIDYKTITFGCGEENDFRATDIVAKQGHTYFKCLHDGESVDVCLATMGRHNVRNALAAIAVAYLLGIPMEVASEGFKDFYGIRQRVLKLEGRYTIIDDAYNASPDSMRAAIDVLCDYKCEGRKIAVLGDMFELGENSRKYHRELGEYIRDKKIDEVVVVGKDSMEIKKAIDECPDSYCKAYSFSDNEEVSIYLMAIMKPEDVVLIKGSNGMKLNEVVNILMN